MYNCRMGKLFAFIIQCSFTTYPYVSILANDNNNRAIVSSIVKSLTEDKNFHYINKYFVFALETEVLKYEPENKTIIRALPQGIGHSLIEINQKSTKIAILNQKGLISSKWEDIRKILQSKDGWSAFYKKYPNSGGVLSISRPSYSADGNTAYVYFKVSCGNLCGASWVGEFTTQNGEWIIRRKHILLIS